jgi:hypothetical protein
MDHRAELVRLITAGTSRAEVYAFFIAHGFEPIEIDVFLYEEGISLPHKPKVHDDGISPERRHELQELSLSKET